VDTTSLLLGHPRELSLQLTAFLTSAAILASSGRGAANRAVVIAAGTDKRSCAAYCA